MFWICARTLGQSTGALSGEDETWLVLKAMLDLIGRERGKGYDGWGQ